MPQRKRDGSTSSVKTEASFDSMLPSPGGKKGGRKESEQKRRVMMNQYFDELIVLLTILSQNDIPKKMDKVATLRESINCLQLYHHLTDVDQSKGDMKPKTSDLSVKPCLLDLGETLQFLLDSEDSFLILISETGRILFSTELITSLLGHMQSRLISQNWFDYLHPKDHDSYRQLLRSSKDGVSIPGTSVVAYPSETCLLHLKLYSGETGGLPQYLPFRCLTYIRKWTLTSLDIPPLSPDDGDGGSANLDSPSTEQTCVLLVGKLPTSLMPVDLSVGTNDVNFEFDMRVSQEGRIIHVDKHAVLVLGYNITELVGTSFFDYIDPFHILDAGEGISSFINTGIGTTTPYRMRTKSGRYIWLISKGYTSYNPWINKPDHVLLTNRILGCDQVLPEHRFYRSRKLLPDIDGEEYSISTLRPSPPNIVPTSSVQPARSSVSTAQSQYQPPSQPAVSTFSQPTLPNPPVSNPQGNFTSNNLLTSSLNQFLTSPTSGLPPPAAPSDPLPLPSSAAGLSLQLSQQTQPDPFPAPVTATHSELLPQNLIDVQKELERKNRELFEMQRILLEQQRLFEQERNQFYQVSQQVMQHITASGSIHNNISASVPNPPKSQPSLLQGAINLEKQFVATKSTESSHNLTASQRWDSCSTLADVSSLNVSVNSSTTTSNLANTTDVQDVYTPHNPPTVYDSYNPPTPFTSHNPAAPYTPHNPPTPYTHHSQSTPQAPYTPHSVHMSDPLMYSSQQHTMPVQQFNMGLQQPASVSQNLMPTMPPPTSGQQSLGDYNQQLMQSLGISTNSTQHGHSQSATLSQVQTLSNLFGGSLN